MIKDIILNVSRSYTPYVAPPVPGILYGWGDTTTGQLDNNKSGLFLNQTGDLNTWVSCSLTNQEIFAIKTDGTLWSWGSGNNGGYAGSDRISPIQVGNETNWNKIGKTASISHVMFIKTDGTLWAYGVGTNGQLGQNINQSRSNLIQVGNLNDWKEVGVGYVHTVGIRNNGTIWAWGTATVGQLGTNSIISRSSPVQIGSGTDWSYVSGGGSFTMAIKTDGTLWGWGQNTQGQLGLNVTVNRSSPVQVGTDTNWSKVSTGANFTLAIKTNGTLWSWGENGSGQLGYVTFGANISSPVQVGLLTNWSEVVASKNSNATAAIKTDGTLWVWGNGSTYGLGRGDNNSISSPIQLGTDTDWKTIDFRSNHLIAIKTNGTFWQFNSNTTQAWYNVFTSPIQITDATNWSKISTKTTGNTSQTTVAVKKDGTLWSWGMNLFGELGDGTVIAKQSPVQIGTGTSWSDVSNGSNFTMAIKTDGTLWTWGQNLSGELGINLTANRSSPVQVGLLSGWSKISAGTSYSMAIRTDGTLWSWGTNSGGQLGIGTTVNRSSPVQIGTDTNWSVVSAGKLFHTLAVKTDGTLWAWGLNSSGQLGTNNTIARSSPVQVGTDTNWRFVNNNGNTSIAIKTDGTLWVWGGDNSALGIMRTSRLPFPVNTSLTNVSDIVAGTSYTIAVSSTGNLWAWGRNDTGNIGDNTIVTRSSPVQIGTDTNWSTVFAGDSHTMSIRNNGTLWAWGLNSSGQLGDGTAINRSSPVQIGTDTNWNTLGCGLSHTMAVRSNGTLWAWGLNNFGQLGDGTKINRSSPIQIGTDTNWTKVSCGASHTLALKSNGTIWSWGADDRYQLGIGSNSNKLQKVGTDTDWSTLPTNSPGSHTMVIKTNGTLWGWGLNTSFQLGDNSNITRSSPVQIGVDTNWSKLALGAAHTVAIKTTGTLWSWGNNAGGQLGLNDISNRFVPTQVGTATDWSEVSCGTSHTIAIKTDGTMWGWGTNTFGEAGVSNQRSNISSPIQIGTDTNWSKISSNENINMAIKTNGTLWTWGFDRAVGNMGLNLGPDFVFDRPSPVQIGTDTNWTKVACGQSHTIALKSDGTLWGWGEGRFNGTVGDAAGINRSSPVQLGTDTNWTDISCGGFHTLALKSNGTLWNWGSGGTGQMPDGFVVTRSSPVQVGSETNWSKIYAGRFHSVAINTANEVYTVGLNSSIAITVNEYSRSSPVQIGTDTNWTDISAYAANSGAIKSNGTLWLWGNNVEGQLGQNNRQLSSAPIQVGTDTNWSSFPKTGPRRFGAMATKNNGTTWGIGYGFDGVYADDTTITRSSPVQIGSIAWSKITAAFHVIAMDSSGSLQSFGGGGNSVLGRDIQLDSISRSSPVQVGSATNWVSASMGGNHTMAIKTDGTLWGWGQNSFYQMGTGTTVGGRSSPVQIGSLTNWKQVECGQSHTIAISEA